MKAFVAGGTGFIGSHLVKRLSQTEHRLQCLARENSDVRVLGEAGAAIVVGDVTDKASILGDVCAVYGAFPTSGILC